MTDRAECPECHGEGRTVYEQHAQICGSIEDDETREAFCFANCTIETVVCRLCDGNRDVDAIQLAVYRARGGLAPVQFRGFA